MDAQALKNRIPGIVESLLPELCALADRIFAHPEVAYEEAQAAGWLADFLEARGFEVERGAGRLPTAFKARRTGGSAGPQIAVISEYDALPGLGHACGHNVIAAMGVGAAAAVGALADALPGAVICVGTPAEEGGGGKIRMIGAGAFDDVDAAMMIHPGQKDEIYRPSLGRVKVWMDFYGKPSHAAAAPERGVNALDALVTTYQNIGLLRQQMPEDARVHAMIVKGGDAVNVIPAHARMLYSVRSLDRAALPELVRRVVACAEGAAAAHGCRLEVEADPLAYEPLKPNGAFDAIYERNLRALGVAPGPPEARPSGSTDFGNLSWKMPAIHPRLKMVDAGVAAHTPEFAAAAGGEAGRALIGRGAQAMAMTAIDLMASPENMARVRRDFAAP